MSFVIHTNAAVEQHLYFDGPFGVAVEFDPTETFKCQVRKRPGSEVVLEFETSGNDGTITVDTIDVIDADGNEVERDALLFSATEDLVADLTPGLYVADIIRTDEPEDLWESGPFPILVLAGVTS